MQFFSYRRPKQSCCVPFPHWNSTHMPGRKIVMFKNFETAISPQPLNEILQNKTSKIIIILKPSLLCVYQRKRKEILIIIIISIIEHMLYMWLYNHTCMYIFLFSDAVIIHASNLKFNF